MRSSGRSLRRTHPGGKKSASPGLRSRWYPWAPCPVKARTCGDIVKAPSIPARGPDMRRTGGQCAPERNTCGRPPFTGRPSAFPPWPSAWGGIRGPRHEGGRPWWARSRSSRTSTRSSARRATPGPRPARPGRDGVHRAGGRGGHVRRPGRRRGRRGLEPSPTSGRGGFPGRPFPVSTLGLRRIRRPASHPWRRRGTPPGAIRGDRR